ncbi:hypothetical protein [Sporosarcina limicola]|uniref:Lactate dehydrogenase-like 2-hydroxyacid dehydrogenase n=1 Tax=Sporosarcina limicola TaxID=34101 RepID=A0A927R7Y0_9BACL|nr:lactate dehydrogenase-like 2-hydroxyacid dehydrogenase [Sporosarcina limicola]
MLWTVLTDSVDRKVLEVAPKLKDVFNLAVRYNNIDIEVAKERGIIVTNTRGVLTETTADLAFYASLCGSSQ